MTEKSTGLLDRWHRRCEQVQREQEGVIPSVNHSPKDDAEQSPITAVTKLQEASTPEGKPPEKLLTAADLPDPEKIEVGGSFAGFMASNVDPKAKTAALRALWKQPHYHEIDGLLDYALDYSNQPTLSAEASAKLVEKIFHGVGQSGEEQAVVEEKITPLEASHIEEDVVAKTNNKVDTLDVKVDDTGQGEARLPTDIKPPVA